eukprot:4687253-Amphidinium_carterae.1
MGSSAMLSNSETTWKGRCQYWKATMVQSTPMWLRRWQVWETPTGPLGMLSNFATTWKGRCE